MSFEEIRFMNNKKLSVFFGNMRLFIRSRSPKCAVLEYTDKTGMKYGLRTYLDCDSFAIRTPLYEWEVESTDENNEIFKSYVIADKIQHLATSNTICLDYKAAGKHESHDFDIERLVAISPYRKVSFVYEINAEYKGDTWRGGMVALATTYEEAMEVAQQWEEEAFCNGRRIECHITEKAV